jgi:hypothetical protein
MVEERMHMRRLWLEGRAGGGGGRYIGIVLGSSNCQIIVLISIVQDRSGSSSYSANRSHLSKNSNYCSIVQSLSKQIISAITIFIISKLSIASD